MSKGNDQCVERYAFVGFTLDTARQVLQGPEGEIRLRPKSYALLLYLVRHQGRVVSREELLDAIWGHLAVTDDSLTQCLVEIRRVLHDGERHIVRTVPRRGYLFEAPVTRLFTRLAADPASPRRPLLVTGILSAFALAAMLVVWVAGQREDEVPAAPEMIVQRLPNSIAVLPFIDMSADQDQEYFGDGLAEEILNLLVQSPELKVIARTSSFFFKDQRADIATITRRLGVAHVLGGSVRKSGNQVRITAQLIAADDGTHLWAQSYDRELGDLLGIQSEIAAAVVHALWPSLLRDSAAQPEPAVGVEAYDHFLRGRFMFHRRDPGDLERAREQFEAAVALEPGYARAWAALSGVYNAQISLGEVSREIGMARRREAAERALALAPGLPEAHLRASTVYLQEGDIERARHHYHKARALDPDDPLLLGLSSASLAAAGRIEEAIEQWDRIVVTDPLSRVSRVNRALHLMGAGRLEEARADLLAARDLGAEGVADGLLALILVLEQRYDEALALLAPIPMSYDRELGLALTHHALGNDVEVAAVVARLQADETDKGALALAQVHAYSGKHEDAFHWLMESQARVKRDSPEKIYLWATSTNLSPFLRPLHDDPHWAALYSETQPVL